MNLYQIYDAVIENSNINDIPFNKITLIEYTDVVFNEYLSDKNADKIMKSHNDWIKSNRGSFNFDKLVRFKLASLCSTCTKPVKQKGGYTAFFQ